MEDDEECNTGLCLGLGMGAYKPKMEKLQIKVNCEAVAVANNSLNLGFELCPKGEAIDVAEQFSLKRMDERDEQHPNYGERESADNNTFNNKKNGCRKKLRLTKEQSAMLEDSFKLHTTLNPAQKQELSDQLNLKPRQIEVWFQNRRARTKLKQTEVDCEFLKKCCQNLTDENRRLKKELQELRALKFGPYSPLCIQLSKAATLTMCSSCQKLSKPNHNEQGNNSNNNHHKLESSIGLEGRN